jgi:uncharacterized protein YhjY with autotransporter beta-barrel domain
MTAKSPSPILDVQPGINEPQPTPQSLGVREQIEAAEADRIAKLEAKYIKTLAAASRGDKKAYAATAQLAAELNWSAERIGADLALIEEDAARVAAIAAFTPEDRAEHKRLTDEVIALGTEKDARRQWLESRQEILSQRLPLDVKRDSAREAERRRAAVRADPRNRAILEAAP